MMVSPIRQTKVQGEINICRYLLRVMGEIPGSDVELSTRVSYWLDVADSLLCGDNGEKSGAVGTLASYLSKNTYLCGPSASLIDVIVKTAVHQTANGGKLTNEASISKWLKSLC